MMKVGIVGAGMAGLGAARTLLRAGHHPVVFEKSRGLGGRLAYRRVGPYLFDHGAASIVPRGRELERVILHELPEEGRVEIRQPIYLHDGLRTRPGDVAKNSMRRWTWDDGISTLAKRLAEGVEVRRETRVESMESLEPGWRLNGENFDAVVLTAPAPQTSALLATAGLPTPLSQVEYRQVIALMFGFDRPFHAPWHALLNAEQDHPITWMTCESIKSPGRAPDGHSAFVIHLSRQASRNGWEQPEEDLVHDALGHLKRLIGQEFGQPVAVSSHRWLYAQPDQTQMFSKVNLPGARCILAGDGLAGPRAELAYESGVEAARLIIQ